MMRLVALRCLSMFKNRAPVPPDVVFSITEAFRNDPSPNKVNLGVGAYQDKNGKPWVLPVVRKVESEIASDHSLDKEYLPIAGHAGFISSCIDLMYGSDHSVIKSKRVDGLQSLSGAGACRLGLEYLRAFQNAKTVYVSKPTWGIHHTMAAYAGYSDVREYRYYDDETRGLNLAGMLEDLENADEGSIVIFHGSGHNPTGVDPLNSEWDEIVALVKRKNLFPYFDCAYMGFCSGDVAKDSYSLRKFAESGMDMFAGLSFAKIMGLYNERIGCFTFISESEELNKILKEQIKKIARNSYSNPPAHGARIVHRVLTNSENKGQWIKELNTMTSRISIMRQELYNRLVQRETPGDWTHIMNQNGLFSYTGLKPHHVEKLAKKHIYMLKSGRISICGLTYANIDYIADCISDVVKEDKT